MLDRGLCLTDAMEEPASSLSIVSKVAEEVSNLKQQQLSDTETSLLHEFHYDGWELVPDSCLILSV